jgi:hypothetical protein
MTDTAINRILSQSPKKSLFSILFPWLLSAMTIWMMWLAGTGGIKAWVVGLVSQIFWLVWIIKERNWGLLPMNLALWVVYIRNLLKAL